MRIAVTILKVALDQTFNLEFRVERLSVLFKLYMTEEIAAKQASKQTEQTRKDLCKPFAHKSVKIHC